MRLFPFYVKLSHRRRYSDLRGVIIAVRLSAILLSLVCLTMLSGLVARAADIMVDATCSLADAITAANNDLTVSGCKSGPDADVIHLSGSIVLNQALPWISSDVIIEGSGYTISGADRFRHFTVDGGALAISDSVIAGNEATDNDSAVFVVRGQSSLRDNAIYGNGRYEGWQGPPRPPLEPLPQQDLGAGRRGSCGNVSGGGAYWLHPLPAGAISRRFKRGAHGGVDLAAPFGTPIRAANGGPISYAGWRGKYGIAVEIQHEYRSTLYAHLGALTVRCGESVAPGQVIGFVGSSGNSSGPHLHFELRVWGRKQDPMLIEAIGW